MYVERYTYLPRPIIANLPRLTDGILYLVLRNPSTISALFYSFYYTYRARAKML